MARVCNQIFRHRTEGKCSVEETRTSISSKLLSPERKEDWGGYGEAGSLMLLVEVDVATLETVWQLEANALTIGFCNSMLHKPELNTGMIKNNIENI